MDLIKELSHLIELNRPSSFGQLVPKDSKLRVLYDLVHNNPLLGNREIADRIYGSGPSDKRFLMLKRNLINKLSELVLIADHSDLNQKNFIKVKFWCEKNLTVANKLLLANVYHNAEKMTLKSLAKAREFHLIDIELNCYVTLRKINYLKGFPDQVQKYQEKTYQALQQKSKQDLSWGLLEFLLGSVKFSRSQSLKVSDEAYHNAREVNFYYSETQNPFFKLIYYRIQLIHFHQKAEYQALADGLDKLRDFLKQYPYLETEQLALEQLLCDIRQKVSTMNWKKALKSINKALKMTSYSSFNKFEVQAEMFELLLKKNQQEGAATVLQEVYATPQFERLDKADKSAWAIRSAYLYLLYFRNAKTLLPGFHPEKTNEFFSLCLAISKDKNGFNLQFIIVRTLLIWLKGGMDFDSESNNLKVYYQRYLKNSSSSRSRLFFKSLEKLTRASFSPRKHAALTEKLQLEMIPYADVLDYNEIISYQILWEKIGELCKIQNQNELIGTS